MKRATLHYACLASAAIAASLLLPRALPAAPVAWSVDASGLWTDTTNWTSFPSLPGVTSDVTINRPAGDFLVTLSSGLQSINSLLTTERLTINGGTLTVANTASIQNTLTLSSGGTIANSTLSFSGAGTLVGSGGNLDNVALATNLTLLGPVNLTLKNTLTLSSVNLNLTGTAASSVLNGSGNVAIAGTGTITMDASNANYADLGAGVFSLTLTPNITVKTGTGNSSIIAYIEATSLFNQGYLSSQTAGSTFRLDTTNFTNTGILEAKNGGIITLRNNWSNSGSLVLNAGTLNLGGNFTTSSVLTNLSRTGGALLITGTLDNTSATLALNAATGNFALAGGTIQNGTLTTTAAGRLTSTSGFLDNVTLGSDFNFPGPQTLALKNTLTLASVNLNLTGTSGNSVFNGTGNFAIAGTGTITLDASNGNYADLGFTATSLTLSPNITIKTGIGNSPTIGYIEPANLLNQGYISSQTPGSTLRLDTTNFTNTGIIEAKNGGIITLRNNWSNSGTLALNAGTISLGGNFTTASVLTHLSRVGGAMIITGTLDNTNALFAINAATGNFALAGGTIQNGTLTTTGGAQLTATSGVLDNVTLGSDFNFPGPQTLALKNTLTLSSVNLNLTGLAGSSVINGSGNVTIAGTGTITLAASNSNYADFGYTATSLTLTPNIVVKTGAGNSPTIAFLEPIGLLNQGYISSQTSGSTLRLDTTNFTNAGILEAKNGGIVTLRSNWSNAGTFVLNAGTLSLGGNFTTAGLGTISRTGGAILITGTLDNSNATLALNAATGNFALSGGTIQNGTLTMANSTQLTSSTGILDNLTLASDFSFPGPQFLNIKNTLTLSSVNLNLTGAAGNSVFNGTGAVTIAGAGTITLDASNGNYADLGFTASSLTISPNIRINIGAGSSTTLAYIDPIAVTLQGVLSHPTVGKTVVIGGTPALISGTLTGPGNFSFTGSNTTISGVYNSTGSLTLNPGSFLFGPATHTAGVIAGNTDLTVNGALTSDAIRAKSLTINGAVTVRPNGTTNGTSSVSGLTLAGSSNAWTGHLELNNNALVVQSDSTNKAAVLSTLRNQISATNGGTVGITSNSALADPGHKVLYAIDNGILNLGSFFGQSVNANSLLVGATWLGDANFDRQVNVTDLGVLATYYGQNVGAFGPLHGDFNQDGIVNVTDLGQLATNYGQGTAPGAVFSLDSDLAAFTLGAPTSPTTIPEPTSLAALLLAAPLLLRRPKPRSPHPS